MRVLIGLLIWTALVGAGIWQGRQFATEPSDAVAQLSRYLAESRQLVELNFDSTYVVKIGDPIMAMNGEKSEVVGVIQRVESNSSTETRAVRTQTAVAEFYSSAPNLSNADHLTYHATPESMDWVVRTMLPSDVRLEIGNLIGEAFRKHQAEIVKQFQPVIQAAYQDASAIIKEEFAASVEARDQQIQKLGERYQTELVENRLIPLVKEEIWPIIDAEGRPLVTKIGLEIWNEASIWRFGWRMFYDQLPLTEQNLTRKEFENFVKTKASPIIEKHLSEIIEVQKNILASVSKNEKVKKVGTESLRLVVQDPDFQSLVTDIFNDIFVDNERLKTVVERHWSSPQAQRAMAITNEKLEPTITRIGQTMFGAPDSNITPGFKRVLRNRIMQKDKRWFVLHSDSPAPTNDGPRTPVERLSVTRGVDSE